jgi:hypothetical protein
MATSSKNTTTTPAVSKPAAKKAAAPKAVAVAKVVAPVAAAEPVAVTKKPAAKKAAAVAPTAAVAAPVAAKKTGARKTQLKPSTAPAPVLTSEQRAHYVSVAAFYIAEQRGFTLGNPADDWIAAEAEVDRLIASGHFTV